MGVQLKKVWSSPIGHVALMTSQSKLQPLLFFIASFQLAWNEPALLNIKPAHWPVNPERASAAVMAVADRGGDAGGLAQAFLRACWAQERDIADEATIASILSETGHDAANLASAMEAAAPRYQENTQLCLQNGVFGAPFYIVGDEKFWGQDRLDYLDWHLGRS